MNRNIFAPLAWTTIAVIAALASYAHAQDKPKAEPQIVSVALGSGGRAVGEIVTPEIDFKTEFGQLRFPWNKVRQVVIGWETRPELAKQIRALIGTLGDGKFEERERAQRELLAHGSRVRLLLEEFRDDADVERRTRVLALLKDIGGGETDGPPWSKDDIIFVGDNREVGKIVSPALDLSTMYGTLRVPLVEIESIGPPREQKPIDLLKKLDIGRDCVVGSWGFDGEALVSPAQSRARLQVPVIPPTNYDLRVSVLGKEGRKLGERVYADSFFITLIVAGRQCNVALNAFGDLEGGPYAGMDAIEGKRPHQTPLHRGAVLELGKESAIVISVRGQVVTVTVDDKPLFEWKDNPAKLSVDKSWKLNDARFVGLGAHQTKYRISRFELVELDDALPPIKLDASEALVRLTDRSLLPVKVDADQTIIVQAATGERKLVLNTLDKLTTEPEKKEFLLTLTDGEKLTLAKLPLQPISFTTRYGKLKLPMEAVQRFERAAR